MKLTILHLHGFLSSAQGEKARYLQHYFQNIMAENELCFLPITYRQAHYQSSVKDINDAIQSALRHCDQLVITGASLGGFYAQYFGSRYQVPWGMINPVLTLESLKSDLIGSHVNFHTQERVEVDSEYLQLFNKFAQSPSLDATCFLYLEASDEVINHQVALERYAFSRHITLVKGGHHRVKHMNRLAESLNAFIQQVQK